MPRTNGGIIGKRNITSFGKNTIHNKTSSGTVTTQSGTRLTNILVVAGGGAGAGYSGRGGGGAGGARLLTDHAVNGSTPIPVTVGGGGASKTYPAPGNGNSGSNSTFGNPLNPISSTGGGGGGGGSPGIGQPGGSGGGGDACGGHPGGSGNAGGFSPVEGFAGGRGDTNADQNYHGGGGGGGASEAGGDGTSPGDTGPGVAGDGGDGIDVTPAFGAAPQPFYLSNVSGRGNTACGHFAGGAAGSVYGPAGGQPGTSGDGGLGGGADGTPNSGGAGKSGVTNSGGGGGGSSNLPLTSGAGGSGIVLVKIPSAVGPVASVTPGTNAIACGPCGTKVAKFTVSGTLVIGTVYNT
jgi:hypothetical protein